MAQYTKDDKSTVFRRAYRENPNGMLGVDPELFWSNFLKVQDKYSDKLKKSFSEMVKSAIDEANKGIETNTQQMTERQKVAYLKAVKERVDSAEQYARDAGVAQYEEYLKQKKKADEDYFKANKEQYEHHQKWLEKNSYKDLSRKERSDRREKDKDSRRNELEGMLSEAEKNENEELVSLINSELSELKKGNSNQELMKKIVSGIHSDLKSLGNAVQSSLNSLYEEQVRFNARTSSYDDAYGNMIKDISKLIGSSPFIKQSDVIKNLSEIANTGSNYNIEQRAYLATLAKDLASTFDIKGEELLRLNRLMRTDLSASRMGMVQNLTDALNQTFNDSSFMNSLRRSVAEGVMDATAQLSTGNGTDFEWAVETWMGALTSAGVNSDVINMLTQGLNFLGSGNVSAMSGNEQMQTLFALAASNSGGKSYSEMLVDGIDASDVNKLMSEMIGYLKDISDENKVVQSEYFRILGMGGLANMTAFKNIDVDEVLAIAQNSRTDINTENYSTSSILSRVNIVKDNLITTMATDIGESVPKLITWILADTLDKVAGGISIPSILGLGTGVIMDAKVADMMKAGVMASTLFSVIPSIATAFKNNGVADFGSFAEQAGGVNTGFGTSLSYAVGSSSSSDIMKSSITSQANQAKQNKKTVQNAIGETEEESSEAMLKSIKKQLDGLYKNTQVVKDESVLAKVDKLFEKFDDDSSPIKVEDKSMNALKDALANPDRVQRVEGVVTLAGFEGSSEKTLNDVLTNAIALALKMILGGATTQGAGDISITTGDGWDGYLGRDYVGSMTLMDFLNRIISSNEQTMSQISDTFGYFAQQQDSSYIR